MSRGVILHAARHAVQSLWGEAGIRAVRDALPAAIAASSLDAPQDALQWVPSAHLVAWHEAIYQGPARRDDAKFRAFVARSVDYGFGRVRRALLSFVTPTGLVRRAADLWKHDHTHGALSIGGPARDETGGDADSLRSIRGTLVDHPFVQAPRSRQHIAELVCHLMTLARARNVRQTHGLDGATTMFVKLTWE